MLQSPSLESDRIRRTLRWLRGWRVAPAPRFWHMLTLLAIAGLATVELAARHEGLHTPVLYEKTSYGYRVRPSQDIQRFGNHIYYDANGMRSEALPASPAAGAVRILFLGDSIVNGGTRTDQRLTIPYLVRDALQQAGRPAEVMNASAPGWAPGNAAGWLNRHGTFRAHYVVAVINSYDLFQEDASAEVVDRHPAFPGSAPVLALQEVFGRYVLPRLAGGEGPADPGAAMREAPAALTTKVLGDLRWMLLRTRSQGAEGVVVLVHPRVVLSPRSGALTASAVRRLQDTVTALGVDLIDTEAAMAQGGSALFRDGLHPNEAGNGIIAAQIASRLATLDAGRR